MLHSAHARSREQRESDDGNFPEIDRVQPADARFRIDARFGCAEADRKAINRPGPQQRDQLAPAGHFRNEPPTCEKASEILTQVQPDADRLGGVVLKQHRDPTDATRRQCFGKGPAHDHIARLIDLAEQAGIAFHCAVGIDRGAWRENGRGRRFGIC